MLLRSTVITGFFVIFLSMPAFSDDQEHVSI